MFFRLEKEGLREQDDRAGAAVIVVPGTEAETLEKDLPVLRYRGPIRYNKAVQYPDGVLGTLNIPKKGGGGTGYRKLYFVLTTDALYLLTVGQETQDATERVLRQLSGTWETPEQVTGAFFLALLQKDFQFLEALEGRIGDMEEMAVGRSLDSFSRNMLVLRKELLYQRRFYDQMRNMGEQLLENTAGLFSKEGLRQLRRFAASARELMENATMLREYSVQVQEIYQAQMDLDQNRTMALLTVVTTVFLPLTLIVGWYGMNFQMPELEWEYSYPLVIVACVIVVVVLIWYFKRKKFL